MGDSEHFVQFYETDEFLVHAAAGFIGSALARGDAGVMAVTPAHRESIQREFIDLGLDVPSLIDGGRLVIWDCDEVIERVSVAGSPDEGRFAAVVGEALRPLAEAGLRVRVFGEAVSVLVSRGQRAAAIRLEELWNELSGRHRFSLFCAYPITAELGQAGIGDVCRQHASVIPGESFSALDGAGERMRTIVQMQHRLLALESEMARRTHVEEAFLRRLRSARA